MVPGHHGAACMLLLHSGGGPGAILHELQSLLDQVGVGELLEEGPDLPGGWLSGGWPFHQPLQVRLNVALAERPGQSHGWLDDTVAEVAQGDIAGMQ
eukprot:10683916-Lingulodinium_polyedra.AAC.1